ncbi:hypothetical protein BC830DRAFT_1126332 [Chytriomyces sp. MP71]|nr:hypothetical protein BC830DRAFT_1126332 [Chytriomyces sp. MP71]
MEGWSTADVAAFVKQLGLGAYEAAMRDNDVTGAELAHADHAMLRQLGIDAVGHRIALLNAVHTKEADTLPATATAPFHAVSGTHGFSDELLIERMSGEILKLHNELAQLKSDLAPIWFLVDEYKVFHTSPLPSYPQSHSIFSGQSRGARADAKTPNTALYPPDLVKRTDSGVRVPSSSLNESTLSPSHMISSTSSPQLHPAKATLAQSASVST